MNERPDATVVIVNYEGRGRLGACLDAVAAQTGVQFDVVVIDNDSPDGSWDEALERPGVHLERNLHNVGFGRACNRGAELGHGRHIALLNYDSTPEPDWLARLVAVLDADPSVGAAQGDRHERARRGVNTAGNALHYLGFAWAPAADEPPDGAPYEVAVGSGASLLVRGEAWRETGGFWEEFFLYHEDVELSWHLRLLGWRVVAVPGAVTWHDYEFHRNPGKLAHMERNRLLTVLACYEAGTLLRLAPALLATELGMLAIAARDDWLGDKLRALGSAARALPALVARRRLLQGARRVGDRTVDGPDARGPRARVRRADGADHARAAARLRAAGGRRPGRYQVQRSHCSDEFWNAQYESVRPSRIASTRARRGREANAASVVSATTPDAAAAVPEK